MPEKTTDQSAIRPAIGVFLRHPTESLLSPRKISGFYDFHQLKSDRLLGRTNGKRHSPPDTGGVDATSSRSREASFNGADGVVRHDETLRPADHPIYGAREAQARQRAALNKVGFAAFFLMPQPLIRLRPIGLALRALLFQEGNCQHFSIEAALAAESN
jgi:hypothetical protein